MFYEDCQRLSDIGELTGFSVSHFTLRKTAIVEVVGVHKNQLNSITVYLTVPYK